MNFISHLQPPLPPHPCLPPLPSSQVYQSSLNLSLNPSPSHSLRRWLHHRCRHCASSFFLADKWKWEQWRPFGSVHLLLANHFNNGCNTYLLGFRHFFFGSFFLCLFVHILPLCCSSFFCAGRVALLLWHSLRSSTQRHEISTAREEWQKTKHTFSFLSFSTEGLWSPSKVLRSSLLGGSAPTGIDADFSLSSSSSDGMSKMRRSWSVPPSIFITAEGEQDGTRFNILRLMTWWVFF